MEDENNENMTIEDYISFLHMLVADVPRSVDRGHLVNHMLVIEDELEHLETCFNLPSYEPQRSV